MKTQKFPMFSISLPNEFSGFGCGLLYSSFESKDLLSLFWNLTNFTSQNNANFLIIFLAISKSPLWLHPTSATRLIFFHL